MARDAAASSGGGVETAAAGSSGEQVAGYYNDAGDSTAPQDAKYYVLTDNEMALITGGQNVIFLNAGPTEQMLVDIIGPSGKTGRAWDWSKESLRLRDGPEEYKNVVFTSGSREKGRFVASGPRQKHCDFQNPASVAFPMKSPHLPSVRRMSVTPSRSIIVGSDVSGARHGTFSGAREARAPRGVEARRWDC